MTLPSTVRVMALSILLTGFAIPAFSASAILVWPVDPVIEADARAAAVWLENRGTEPVLLQLRIFSWKQQDGQNVYLEQTGIVATPPMVEVAPGARQLARLTRTVPAPPGEELAYRIIIDEIPRRATDGVSAAAGVRFQLRYSIPLFVYGEGASRPRSRAGSSEADGPRLSWRNVMHEGRAFLEVQNHGSIHARLTRAQLQGEGTAVSMADGLLGYVLPGATMRWPLPQEMPAPGGFMAAINGARASVSIPPDP